MAALPDEKVPQGLKRNLILALSGGAILAVIVFATDFPSYFLKVTKSMIGGEEILYVEPEGKPAITPVPAGEPNILISEIFLGNDAMPPFVELYHDGNTPADMTGFSIKKESASGNETTFVTAQRLDGVSVSPYGHLLIARASSTLAADVYWPKSYTLPKTNSSLVLYDSSGQKIDEASWSSIPAGSSLARIAWSGNDFAFIDEPSPQGKALAN